MKNIKTYITSALGVGAAVLLFVGCQPLMYAQNSDGTYPVDTTDNGYNYDFNNGYNDPPPEQDPGTYSYGDDGDNQYYQQNTSSEPTITYDDFYTQLSPYGQWVGDPTYGRVWVPNVANFQPYSTNGYWSYTNYGWTWISSYAWGWAPFHYGRWGYGSRGWFWVPGYSWGPAWVAWSSGSNMYGWAPLSPGARLSVGVSIGSIPSNYWTFMPSRYMGTRNIYNYYEPRTRNVTIIRNTTIINNYGTVNGGKRRYTMGPQRQEVERATGRTIQPTRVVTARDAKSAISERTINRGTTTNSGRTTTSGTSRTVTTPTQQRTTTGNTNNTPQRTTTTPPQRQVTTAPQRSNVTPPARTNTQTSNPPARTTTSQPVTRQPQRSTSTQPARSYTETQMYRPAVKPSTNTRPVQSRSAAPARSSRSATPRGRR